MNNSIYVALSKQVGAQRELSVVANNLANANTVGYKSEKMLFKEHLQPDAYNRKTSYANDIATMRDSSAGRIEQTDNQLDFAIDGDAYFAVQTPQGEMYTKAGNFIIDQDGALATPQGYKVLDSAGSQIEFEDKDKEIKVYADGRMEVDGEQRSTLGMYEFQSPQALKNTSGNLYSSNETPVQSENARIMQGVLERSNVEPILQITHLIEIQRDFNSTNKFMNDMYDMQETSIRTIAKQA